MIIEITASGGFGGLNLPQAARRLDLSAQSEDRKAVLCAAFDPERLAGLAARASTPGAADMMTYHITVTDPAGAIRKFELREDQVPPEMLDMIDEM